MTSVSEERLQRMISIAAMVRSFVRRAYAARGFRSQQYHEKLLDPAKNHVTNFQLKPAKNSEILLEKLLFLMS